MPDINSILLFLSNEALRAHLYYGIAKAIRERSQEPEFEQASNLLSGSYYATIRESILAMSKILLMDRESICMEYLFNYAEQNTREFPNASSEEIRELINSSRDEFHTFDSLVNQIQHLRDTELAHMDKRQINNPNLIIPVPIEFNNLENCMALLIEILNRFHTLNRSPLVIFEDYYELASQDIDRIFSTLRKKNESVAT